MFHVKRGLTVTLAPPAQPIRIVDAAEVARLAGSFGDASFRVKHQFNDHPMYRLENTQLPSFLGSDLDSSERMSFANPPFCLGAWSAQSCST